MSGPSEDPRAAFGSAPGRLGPSGRAIARLRAARRGIGARWQEMLGEQAANEQVEAIDRIGARRSTPGGTPLRGWPYTPVHRVFRRRPRPRD